MHRLNQNQNFKQQIRSLHMAVSRENIMGQRWCLGGITLFRRTTWATSSTTEVVEWKMFDSWWILAQAQHSVGSVGAGCWDESFLQTKKPQDLHKTFHQRVYFRSNSLVIPKTFSKVQPGNLMFLCRKRLSTASNSSIFSIGRPCAHLGLRQMPGLRLRGLCRRGD